jgi:lysophospholipase L1-like esterase
MQHDHLSIRRRFARFAPALVACLSLVSLLTPARAADEKAAGGGLKSGDYVAIIGDSITEQKQYSVFIEDYLTMCRPAADLRATQFGWGGETAPGFVTRMGSDFEPFKATVATTCYGMNDGGYSPMDERKAKLYRDAQAGIVRRMKQGGVRFIVVGSPGAVDTDTFRRDPKKPEQAHEASAMYNKTLAELRDIAQQVAKEQGVAFANVYDPMIQVMQKAKAKYGNDYHVCGGDGVHPDANGHLVMAYAFLKGLGVDGEIGTITVDLASGKAEASEGHKVLKADNGAVEIESSRYPFCFYGDGKSTNSTRSVLGFFPFNDELNRFRLVVKGAKQDHYQVTWGDAKKEFSGSDLEKGINLAAEFLDNPFSEPFKKVEGEIHRKQNYETPLVKTVLHDLPGFKGVARQVGPEEVASLDRLAEAGIKRDKALGDEIAKSFQPVKHTIRIEPVK